MVSAFELAMMDALAAYTGGLMIQAGSKIGGSATV